MADVFLSYKREDRGRAKLISDGIEKHGYSVFFDEEIDVGQSWNARIEHEIKEAKCVVVLWSERSIDPVNGEWVHNEARIGKTRGILAPAFIGECKTPIEFSGVQAADLSAWRGDPSETEWVRFIERVAECVQAPPKRLAATPLRRRSVRIVAALLALVVIAGGVVAGGMWLTHGRLVAEAEAALPKLQTPDEHRAFLGRYGGLSEAAPARTRLTALDEEAWEAANEQRTTAAYEAYLAAFPLDATPPGRHATEARAGLVRALGVQRVEEGLSRLGYFAETPDGRFTGSTRAAIRAFQTAENRNDPNIQIDGNVDPDGLLLESIEAVEARLNRPDLAVQMVAAPAPPAPPPTTGQAPTQQTPPQHAQVSPATLRAQSTAALTRADLAPVATRLGITPETLAAVISVVRVPNAFTDDGHPFIIFERHLFSRYTNGRYDASHPQISNPRPGGYPRTQQARWAQLEEAWALDPEAAARATTWGMFQILGSNYQMAGYPSAVAFVQDMARSEARQLAGFEAFVRGNGLADELQRLDWAGFATRYNGRGNLDHYVQRYREAYARETGAAAP